jgi:serine/threonine protein kinase
MANNYSSDSQNAAPLNNPAQAHSERDSGLADKSPASSSNNGVRSTEEGKDRRRLAAGTELSSGRYKIEKLIASGGMGAVYMATDTRFNRPCAVKEMLDEFRNENERSQAVEWFSREATLLLDLNHPCIPRVRDFFTERSKYYLVMDLIKGHTLADMLDIQENVVEINGVRGITELRARDWTRQMCGVLSYLHRQSPPIIFRDLKPSNIMITDRDEIKLIDFGIARTFQSQQQSTVIMTLGYAPPEQLHGMPEPRSDIYALGATIHRLLTRHDATNNKPTIFSFPPIRSLRPDVSIAFEQIIMKAVAPNLDQRWASAEAMERAILNLPPITVVPPLLQNQGVQTRSPNPGQPLTPNVPISAPPLASPQSTPSIVQNQPVTSSTTGPAGSYILAALGHLAANPPRVDPAYEAVTYAYSLEPNNALVHQLFGRIFAHRLPRSQAQIDNALRAYNTSVQLNPNNAETHKLIGDIWLFLRPNFAYAISEYTQSLKLNGQDFEAHERLAQCYEKTNQLDAAIREYQEALRLAPSQPPTVRAGLHYMLGLLANRVNQLPLAEHSFVQVLVTNPGDNQTRFLLSQVYERENKLEEAFTQCGYVIGPLSNNPAVQQLYYSLKNRLGR